MTDLLVPARTKFPGFFLERDTSRTLETLKMISLSEKLYTVKEVAYLLRCSYDTARRDFLAEEGVLERNNSGDRKRLYRQILIPESVLLRVLRRRERKPVPHRSAA